MKETFWRSVARWISAETWNSGIHGTELEPEVEWAWFFHGGARLALLRSQVKWSFLRSFRKSCMASLVEVQPLPPIGLKEHSWSTWGKQMEWRIGDIERGEICDWFWSVNVEEIVLRVFDAVASGRIASTVWLKTFCYHLLDNGIEQCRSMQMAWRG